MIIQNQLCLPSPSHKFDTFIAFLSVLCCQLGCHAGFVLTSYTHSFIVKPHISTCKLLPQLITIHYPMHLYLYIYIFIIPLTLQFNSLNLFKTHTHIILCTTLLASFLVQKWRWFIRVMSAYCSCMAIFSCRIGLLLKLDLCLKEMEMMMMVMMATMTTLQQPRTEKVKDHLR